jgi:hypothetical protein
VNHEKKYEKHHMLAATATATLVWCAGAARAAPLPVALALFWEDETDEALVHDMRARFVGRLSIQPHELTSEDIDALRATCDLAESCPHVPVPGVVISEPRRMSSTDQLSVADFVAADGVEAFALGRGAKLNDLYRFLESRAVAEALSPAAMWRASRMDSVADFQRLCALREGLCVVLFASSAADAPWALLGDALRGFAPQSEAFSLMWAESYSTLHAELNIALPTTPSIAVIEPRRKKVAVLALKGVDAPTARRWLQKFDIQPGEYQDAFYADVPPFASPLQEAAPSSIRRTAT